MYLTIILVSAIVWNHRNCFWSFKKEKQTKMYWKGLRQLLELTTKSRNRLRQESANKSQSASGKGGKSVSDVAFGPSAMAPCHWPFRRSIHMHTFPVMGLNSASSCPLLVQLPSSEISDCHEYFQTLLTSYLWKLAQEWGANQLY